MNNNEDNPHSLHKEKPGFLKTEMEWMAAEGYADSKKVILRKIAMREILRISKSDKFDAFIPYNAMNMFDRFISRHQVPTMLEGIRDDVVLAADSCLSITWRLSDDSFSYDELVEIGNLDMDSEERVTRKIYVVMMEREILRGIEWRMQVETPIIFMQLFVGKIRIAKGIKRRTLNEIIIQTQGDIGFTRFLPTVIAASAVLTACRILFNDFYDREELIRKVTRYVEEEDLEHCLEETYKMCIEKQILQERDLGFEDWSELYEEMDHALRTSSSSSNRTEEDPMQEQIQNEPKGRIDPYMNFELKWMLDSSEDPEEWTINSPDFRTLDPNDARLEARSYFGYLYNAVIAPFRSCIIL